MLTENQFKKDNIKLCVVADDGRTKKNDAWKLVCFMYQYGDKAYISYLITIQNLKFIFTKIL